MGKPCVLNTGKMSKETVLITGGSRGIGRAAAELFAARGCNVAVTCIKNSEKAEEFVRCARDKGCCAEYFTCDAGNHDNAARVTSLVMGKFGSIDVLVNNCGISEYALIQDITPDMWKRMIKTNLDSVYNFVNCVAPSMISRKSGAIINVASMWGLTGGAMESHYSAAKAGVVGFTKALAKELCYSGITVNCVAPGPTDTDMMKESFSEEELKLLEKEIPFGRLAAPSEIAEGIYYLAFARTVTGTVLNMSMGMGLD